MELKSNDFEHSKNMPSELTCDGEDVSPHLAWSGEPEGTKSFALSCFDPDAPGSGWVHWYVHDIPASVHELAKGAPVPAGAVEVTNDFGKTTYGGPCPPSGTHQIGRAHV